MVRLFDPVGFRTEEYRSHYPELSRIPEFNDLNVRELLFVWWYANPTSPLMAIEDKRKRIEESLNKSGFNPGQEIHRKLLELHFPDKLALAIERMSKFDVPIRIKAQNMVNSIMTHYDTIIEGGIGNFVDEKNVTDHKKFVDTTAKITETLPTIIRLVEEGFGIAISEGGNATEEEIGKGGFNTDFYKDGVNK